MTYAFAADTWLGYSIIPNVYPNIPVDNFILKTTEPTAENTGFIPGTLLDIVTGSSVTYSTPGQIIQNTQFDVNVNITVANVQFINCYFRGQVTTTANHIVRGNAAGYSAGYFERCTFRNRCFPSDGADGGHGGFMGKSVTMVRCDISGFADGIAIVGSDVTLQGCYIHDLWFTSPNSDHASDGSHCDCIQGHGTGVYNNITIEGCALWGIVDASLTNSQAQFPPNKPGATLLAGNTWYDDPWETQYAPSWQGYGYPPWGTSAILFGYTSGAGLNNLIIDSNWIDGGSFACINLNNNFTNANCSNIQIIGNRVRPHNRDAYLNGGRPYLLICKNTLTVTMTGNTYFTDGASADTSRRNG